MLTEVKAYSRDNNTKINKKICFFKNQIIYFKLDVYNKDIVLFGIIL